MTGNDIFSIASGYMAQKWIENTDFTEFVPGMLTVLLQEALPAENSLRRSAGQTELTEAQLITADTMDTEISYHDEITRIALPYGLAADLFRIDDQLSLMNDFRQRYVIALDDCLKADEQAITDLY